MGPMSGQSESFPGISYLDSEREMLSVPFVYLFIYFWLQWVFVAVCGLFSSCGEQGLLFVVVRELLIVVASLVAEHGL